MDGHRSPPGDHRIPLTGRLTVTAGRVRGSASCSVTFGINIADLAVAREYYDVLMPMLGFESFVAADDQHAYRPTGAKPGTYLSLYVAANPQPDERDAVGLQHLASMVSTRQAVLDVHPRAVELGSAEIHQPQEFPQYPRRTSRPSGGTRWGSPSRPSATTTAER